MSGRGQGAHLKQELLGGYCSAVPKQARGSAGNDQTLWASLRRRDDGHRKEKGIQKAQNSAMPYLARPLVSD
jgi:hypothetical protein